MKNLLIVLFLFCISININAQEDHYVRYGVGGTHVGTLANPFSTIAQVNAHTFVAGDRVLFCVDDTWAGETLTPGQSGSSGAPITYGSYGTGAKPVISGFTTVSGWTDNSGGIYRKAITCDVAPRMVTVNGVNTPMGRWPRITDAQYNMYDGFTSSTITDAPLASRNFTGGNVLIRVAMGLTVSSYINSHYGSTISFNGVSGIEAGYGYFIYNHISTLTQLGDWCVTGSAPNFTLYMFFGTASPTSYTVKIAASGDLINASNRSYITIDGLALEGGNNGVYTSASDYLTVQNCDIRHIGSIGVKFWGYGGGGGSYNTIDNNTFTDCNNMAVETSWWREFNHVTITNNTLLNIGIFPGMGADNWQAYEGIRCFSDNSLVQYNHLTNIGTSGIRFYGQDTKIWNNFIDHATGTKSDAGGIYTVQQNEGTVTGMEIKGNIVINSVGVDDQYQPFAGWGGFGIYLDDRTTNCLVEGNTVYNCSASGIFLHGSINVQIRNNKIMGAGNQYTGTAAQLASVRDFAGEPVSSGIEITGNQFVALNTSDPSQSQLIPYTAIFSGRNGDSEIINSISSAGNNYYAMPLYPNSGNLIRLWPNTMGAVAVWQTLAQWKAYSGKDATSHTYSGPTISSISKAHVIYNETKAPKNFSFTTPMYDVANTPYTGIIILQPYTSLLLFGEGIPTGSVAGLPSVTTVTPFNITTTSAISGGNVVSDGGVSVTSRGICWATTANPSLSNSHTSNGSGIGIFSSNITGLTPNTIYYVRAYATNSVGTTYGVQTLFVTSEAPVTLSRGKVVKYLGKIVKHLGKIVKY